MAAWLCACASPERTASEADAGRVPAAASATPPLATTAVPASPGGSAEAPDRSGAGTPPLDPSAPCRGKSTGAHACVGDRLVACRDGGAHDDVKTCLDIERCDADKGSCEPACPDGSVYIPPTDERGFVMGRGMSSFGFGSRASGNKGAGEADAPHRVVLTRPFCIDATEVTVAAYIECVDKLGCAPPSTLDVWATYPKKLDYPVNMVSWTKARAFCDKTGKSLPTEAQWEWAASGGDGRKWPWGNETPTCERADFTGGSLPSPGGDAGCHGGGPSPVKAHPSGAKTWPTGLVHDLAGNVWEWCLDNYEPYPYGTVRDPRALRGEGGNHVVRGGGWNRSHRGIETSFRGAAIVTYQVPGLGFRCVRNPR